MTYIAYVTVQYYHVKQPDEHENPCSVAEKIWIILVIFVSERSMPYIEWL